MTEVAPGDGMRATVGHPEYRCPTRLDHVRPRGPIALALSAVVLAGTGAGLAGCASSRAGGTAPEVVPEGAREPAVVVSVPLLAGTGDLVIGRPGTRPVVVNLWASWCGPCKEEMPIVQRFAAVHPAVRVVGIAIDDSPDAARAFARTVGVTFPLGVDDDGRVGDAYGVSGLPTTLVLDRKGRLAATWAGPVTGADLDRLTSSLVRAS